MNRLLRLAALSLACAPLLAHAHRPWLLPSSTVSTVNQWVTVDAAVSTDLFYFDHVPLRIDALQIVGPDGKDVQAENIATGKYRTTFDLHLTENGTYRLANINSGLFANYEENGAQKRWRGTIDKFAAEVPANAQNLRVSESIGRVETFVTAGQPTTDALKPTNVGLELVPITHPNDLYVGEAAKFGLLLDGKPAPNLDITIIASGSRYRNQPGEIKAKTDGAGQFSVTWPNPGMYWLETGLQDEKTSVKQAKQRRVSYVATFEVLPQ